MLHSAPYCKNTIIILLLSVKYICMCMSKFSDACHVVHLYIKLWCKSNATAVRFSLPHTYSLNGVKRVEYLLILYSFMSTEFRAYSFKNWSASKETSTFIATIILTYNQSKTVEHCIAPVRSYFLKNANKRMYE